MNKKILLTGGVVLVLSVAVVCAIGATIGGWAWLWLKSAAVDDLPAIPAPTPAAEAPAVDFSPRPALGAEIRQPDALAGEPVLVSVWLRNAGALAAAHSSEAEAAPLPLLLNGNWRDFVELTVEPLVADGQHTLVAVEAARLNPGLPEPESAVGVRALAAVWVLPPDNTAQWEPGDYRVMVKLKTAGLLAGDFADLEAQADFSLGAPGGPADTARLEQSVAFYDLKQNNCEAAIEHALKAIELDPASTPAYWYAAECYALTGQPAAAVAVLADLQSILSLNPAGSDYHAAIDLRLAQLRQINE